jgi:hypothetical protein
MARSYSRCEVLYQDFLAMVLPQSRFDGVFANASLFHVPSKELPRVLLELSEALRPRGVLFCSNPRGNNEEGFSGDRYCCFFDLDTWRNYVSAAGFFEVRHYYRPPGLPRHKQPWLASVWRKGVAITPESCRRDWLQIHPDRLIQYHLRLSDVLTAARRATGVRGAGFIDTWNQRVVFQSEGQSLTADDIARTVLLSQGAASVTLGNVADVVEAPEPPIGGAAIQGKRGVVINVSAQFGATTVEVTRAAEVALEELRPTRRPRRAGA